MRYNEQTHFHWILKLGLATVLSYLTASPRVAAAVDCDLENGRRITVANPAFEPPALSRDHLPMTLSRSNNITLAQMILGAQDIGFVLHLQQPARTSNQYAISIDREPDGDGDLWVYILNPFGSIAWVTDEDFRVHTQIPICLLAQGRQILLKVPKALAGIEPAALFVSYDLNISQSQTPLFRPIGHPIERVYLNDSIKLPDETLLEAFDATGFIFFQDGKAAPPRASDRVKKGDGDGDGEQDDFIYLDNTLLLKDPNNGKILGVIEWWYLNRDGNDSKLNRFGKKIKHDDNGNGTPGEAGETVGWIAECPYNNGVHDQIVRYAPDTVTPIAITHDVHDGKDDDDRDGKTDTIHYFYDLVNKRHVTSLFEATDGTTHSCPGIVHQGPYSDPTNIPFPQTCTGHP